MSCFVGELISEQCHKEHYKKEVPQELIRVSDLSAEEQCLLKLRISKEITNICHYHKDKYLDKYNHIYGKKCCDPFGCHKKPVKNGLRKILMDHLSKRKNVDINLIPGQALCPTCATKIFVEKPVEEEVDCVENDPEFHPQPFELVEDNPLHQVESICETLELSPLCKISKLNTEQRLSALQRKTDKITSAVKRKLEESFHKDLEAPSQSSTENIESEYDILITKLKEKFKDSSKDDKIKIISLLPRSWSKQKIIQEFGASEYMVKLTRQLTKDQGILPHLSKRNGGNKISEVVKNSVKEFYEDDENSRLCPGKKECVSTLIDNVRVHKQKRLILLSLNELYSLYKQKYPDHKIGRSMFCALRPKWCVLPGSSGTHSVCVCKHHQNAKLMIEGAKLNANYKDLISFMVCDIENEKCMLDSCEKCPGPDTLVDVLENELEILPDEVVFKQWVQTDRAELITQVMPSEEFLHSLVEKLVHLKSHHFISKAQAQYFKETKENLTETCCLVIGDFAENYTFTVQDEIQSFHWTNTQATLHPFVIYFKKQGKVCCKSICVISDHLDHNTTTVYTFQHHLISEIKKINPNFEMVIYFSDGASSQYKNKKNFINVCLHKNDFGLKAEWNFFASSHGKNSCDGIGGTTKREVTRASLKRPYTEHILTPQDMFKYCRENITGVQYIFVPSAEIKQMETKLTERFECCLPVKGTRSYHRYIPISGNQIRCFVTSAGSNFDDHQTSILFTNVSSFTSNDYVACIYDDKWWLGKIEDKSEVNNDVLVHFFHPSGPKTAFQLSKNDTAWVPAKKIVRKVTPLELTTVSGRTHNINEKLCNEISSLFNSLMKIAANK